MIVSKFYLGDSVYAAFDGYHIVLTTDNGLGASNTIYLEPQVFAALQRYQATIAALSRQSNPEPER